MTEPEHLSYSSLSTYEACPRSYYLSRIKQAVPVPAWYFIVGSAVHDCIEAHIKGEDYSLEATFMRHVSTNMDIEADINEWMNGGPDHAPVVKQRALRLAVDCLDKALTLLEDMTVWDVERDITGHLPGCTMPIKAYPDILGEHKKEGPVIWDWKTGTTRGKRLQLETYNCLIIEQNLYPDVTFRGKFVMLNPAASPSRPLSFKESPVTLGQKYGMVEERIKRGIYPAMPSFNCKFCTMLPNCSTMSGATKRTAYYDTPTKDGKVPF